MKSFRHKGLRALYEAGSAAGVQPNNAKRLRMQLAALDTAHAIDDMDFPGFRLHRLKGEMAGRWSIMVSGRELAKKMDVAPSTVSRVLSGTSRVTPEMALRLSTALGRSAESWLAMQDARDLCVARQTLDLGRVRRVVFASS